MSESGPKVSGEVKVIPVKRTATFDAIIALAHAVRAELVEQGIES